MALPAAGGSSLQSRDTVKLNQYANLGDCQNDRNILYHAAPVALRCYNLDGRTGALFINPGPFISPTLYPCSDCRCNAELVYDTKRCINRDFRYGSFMVG
ncbi:hypothetical protein HJFPF1_05545 [Paramyrothecium foliicola]|nr:hypothetical protein HJFPF1_05545 [Paramyrothecium foliicola]